MDFKGENEARVAGGDIWRRSVTAVAAGTILEPSTGSAIALSDLLLRKSQPPTLLLQRVAGGDIWRRSVTAVAAGTPRFGTPDEIQLSAIAAP